MPDWQLRAVGVVLLIVVVFVVVRELITVHRPCSRCGAYPGEYGVYRDGVTTTDLCWECAAALTRDEGDTR